MAMADLIMAQLSQMLKASGFDAAKAQAQVTAAVDDIHQMKLSQERCEQMLRDLCEANSDEYAGYKIEPNITVTDKVVIGKEPKLIAGDA